MASDLNIMLPEQIADVLSTPVETVIGLFETGQLRGFQLNGEWRTTREALADLVENLMEPRSGSRDSDQDADVASGMGSIGERVTKLGELEQGWDSIDGGLEYGWPVRADRPHDQAVERYPVAYHRLVDVADRRLTLVIAFGCRDTAGDPKRPRAVVFQGRPGRTLTPWVEFAGANDFAQTKRFASVIKRRDGKHVRPGEPLPDGYDELPHDTYNRIVSGPGAAGSQCVVAREDELGIMAMHAILRAMQRGWL